MYYRENGKLIENPIWYNVKDGALIVNMRKLKLIFNKGVEGKEEIFEFVIQEVSETHTDGQLRCEVTATGLAFQELGKIGYKISLSSDDYIDEYNQWFEEATGDKPINNINYWCDKIFEGSNWEYEIDMDWSNIDGISAERGAGARLPEKIYEDEYVSSWLYDEESESVSPAAFEPYREKCRLVDLEKSNIYNLTQDVAEIFGVHCKYRYEHDENGHITRRVCTFYNNFIAEKEGAIDIIYPFGASKVERKIESADIVTKMFVTPIDNEFSPAGQSSITDVAANKSREDYILNFDYLYSIGTITEEQYAAIPDFERNMFIINTELEPLEIEGSKIERDLAEYRGRRTILQTSTQQAKEQMNQAKTMADSITNGGNLYRNKDNPLSFVLLETEIPNIYYIKMTVEGVDATGKVGYKLTSTDAEDTYGMRFFYYNSATTPELIPYATNVTNPEKLPIPSVYDLDLETDDFGNVTTISGFTVPTDAVSKRIVATFAYNPKLQYENVYNTYARRLAKDEGQIDELDKKIASLESKLTSIQAAKERLLEKKKKAISNFENMMGPALREGSWQADNPTDYGDKFVSIVKTTELSTDPNLEFFWDTEPFDGETENYEKVGATEDKVYYYAILLNDGDINAIRERLDDVSFVYTISGNTTTKDKYLTIGSQMKLAYVKKNMVITPVLLLIGDEYASDLGNYTIQNRRLGVVSSSFNNGEVEVKIEELRSITEDKILSPTSARDYTSVFPRIRVKSLFLKIADDELTVKATSKMEGEIVPEDYVTLENYYDYYILFRDENYFLSIKEDAMLKNNIKQFEISYALSNASLALYLDALEVSKTNAAPQVSYTVDVSGMNESFIRTAYNSLNRIVSINDSDMKFENVMGYISEVDLSLDKPWEDSITVQNYKTKFEDLFSTIVASTEQMRVNSYSYDAAASAFGPGGALKQSVVQNVLSNTDLSYSFQNGKLTIDEVNGIWATSDAGVVAMRGGGIFCATQRDNAGNWVWNTGIMPSGINASQITAGQIDTNLIKVYAGDNLRLQLNADGLFAYKEDGLGGPVLDTYIVHNSEGLFLSDKGTNRVEVSWNGLILRNEEGTPVFSADDEGNLQITGEITANTGAIGNWKITEKGLVYEKTEGGVLKQVAGLVPKSGSAAENGLSGDKIFWVEGTNGNTFMVSDDGSLYCNDIIAKGIITGESIVGNMTVDEIGRELKSIKVIDLDGSHFSFSNKNYDNVWVIEPPEMKFRIFTQALTDKELTENDGDSPKEGYKFWRRSNLTDEWTEIALPSTIISFEKEYLTFRAKSDIMYVGAANTPQNIQYFRVSKNGRLREVSDTGVESYVPTTHEALLALTSETIGAGKHISSFSPTAYAFIRDLNTSGTMTKTFQLEFTGFTKEEIEARGYWVLKGETTTEYRYNEAAVEGFTLEELEGGQAVGGGFAPIIAKVTLSSTKVPLGGKVEISFHIDEAARSVECSHNQVGESAMNIIIRSSSGDTLTYGDVETYLTTEIYFGSQEATDSYDSLFYFWKKNGEKLTQINTATGTFTHDSSEFFSQRTIKVLASDLGLKTIYSCEVYKDRASAESAYSPSTT